LIPEPRLVEQLRELIAQLNARGVRHALIGGLAVGVYGHVRATRDIDLLIDLVSEPAVSDVMRQLGYEVIDRRENLSSYVRGSERADFLHAHRDNALRILAEARPLAYSDVALPVVSLEGLIGFKIQAYTDDPRRLRDLSDMLELVRLAGQDFNWDEVREYFRTFHQDELFNALKQAADADGA